MVIFILKVFMTRRKHEEIRLESHFYNQRMLLALGVTSMGADSSRGSAGALARCLRSASERPSDVVALSSSVEAQRRTPVHLGTRREGRGAKERGETKEGRRGRNK